MPRLAATATAVAVVDADARIYRALLWGGALLIAVGLWAGSASAAMETEKDDEGNTIRKYVVNRERQKDGRYTEYYPGKSMLRKIVTSYKDGKLDGSYKSYHENKKVHIDAEYKDGKLHGDYEEKDEDGKTVKEATYLEGEYHGVVTYYEDGKEARTEEYIHGYMPTRTQEEIKAVLQALAAGEPVPEAPTEEEKSSSRRSRSSSKSSSGSGNPYEALYSTKHEGARRRLQQYRYIVEIPYKDIVLDNQLNDYGDWGAKILAQIGSLTHHPKNSVGWPEADFKKAYIGCSKANLSMNTDYALSVDAYMFDSDPSNIDRLGHRRWCINPSMLKVGFGAAAGGKGKFFGSMMAHDTSGKGRVPDWDLICYPARGYMPVTLFPLQAGIGGKAWMRGAYAWSVTVNTRKFQTPSKDAIKVTVRRMDDGEVEPIGGGGGRRGGRSRRGSRRSDKDDKKDEAKDDGAPGELPLDYFNVENGGFGEKGCIIFRPKGVVVGDGAVYKVEIDGVQRKDGTPYPIRYAVQFFDDR